MAERTVFSMPNIKPISDLRNYNEVLRDVAAGEPVFLTKNGRGRYAVVDIQEYEKSQAMVKLLTELAGGVRSGQEEGWLALDDVVKTLLGCSMAKVQISPLAQQDLLNIRQYIETELANPAAARRTVERMLKAIRQLEQFPLSGAPLQYNGADTGYRYVTSGNYVAFYIGTRSTVQVVRVLYGRRDTIRILLGRSFQPEEPEKDTE